MTQSHNPMLEDLSLLLEELPPMGAKSVVAVIGRFQPPTLGHYALIDAAKRFIRKNKALNLEAAPYVIIIGGNKQDANKGKNPLSLEDREKFMRASGKANGVNFITAPNAYAGLAKLREAGLEPIAVASGSDRSSSYLDLLDKQFLNQSGKKIKHHTVNLDRQEDDGSIDRLKGEKGVELSAVSGSLARRAAELGYEPEFTKLVGLDEKPELAKKLFNKVKSSMVKSND